MPLKLTWTAEQDAQILRLRTEGVSWDGIAASLARNRWAVLERGRRINAPRPQRGTPARLETTDREPLPAGHPISWNALIAGSVLDGTPYPLPCFPC
ncbi:MAG: AsnC family protein [Acetobacteraceae bacterium]